MTVRSLSYLGVHTGTHVDAPLHFVRGGAGIDQLVLSGLVGPARVIVISDPHKISVTELEQYAVQSGERLLFKTSNSFRCWSSSAFVPDYVYLSTDGARYLVERQVRTVGIDYLSIGSPSEGPATHRELLEAGVCIIEGLNLSRVPAGLYDLVCLPLKILNGDGAPARAILRPRGSTDNKHDIEVSE